MNKEKFIKKLKKFDFNNSNIHLVFTPDEELPTVEQYIKKYKKRRINNDNTTKDE